MTVPQFIRLIVSQIKILILIPVVLTLTVYLLTKGQPKEYVSTTVIYTGLVSGYTIESGRTRNIDYHAVRTAFDNLINIIETRATLQEVGIQLLAQHLMVPNLDSKIISPESAAYLHELIPDAVSKELIDSTSVENTIKNLQQAVLNKDHVIYQILHSESEHYSVEALSGIKVTRMASSDLLEISYRTNDPGICHATLQILIEIFMRKYKMLKKGETSAVVDYFRNQTHAASERLKRDEEKLKTFRKKNRIINYYEQTKRIAVQAKDVKNEFHEDKMRLAAADSALATLERKINLNKLMTKKNIDIINLKDQLTKLTTHRALSSSYNKDAAVIDSLDVEINLLRQQLSEKIATLHQAQHTPEGLSKKEIVAKWLDNLLLLSEYKVRLKELEQKRDALEKEYDKYASLGSTLSRLERKVNVAEREYLELLHSLNMAKLRQQNLELSNKLSVVDEPDFPIRPEPTKRTRTVLLAFVAGLVLSLALIIAMEYFDTTIKTPQRAEKKTGLKLAGALPLVLNKSRHVDYDTILSRSLRQLIGNILTQTNSKGESKSLVSILVSSHQRGEGKTFLSNMLAKQMQNMGYHVLRISPDERTGQSEGDTIKYNTNKNFFEITDIESLLDDKKIDTRYQYVILELPAINEHQIPFNLMSSADVSLLVVRANRAWNEADEYQLKTCTNDGVSNPSLVLNGMKIDNLESILGEIPKKRSWLRGWIKKVSNFEFQTSMKGFK